MVKLSLIHSWSTVNVMKRTFGTQFTAGKDSLPLTPDHAKVTKRKVPVASGKAFREQECKRKQEPVKCLKHLRSLIAIVQDNHLARVEEYNALRAQGLRPDPVRQPNLLRVLEIILKGSEEEENELINQNAAKLTKPLRVLLIKTLISKIVLGFMLIFTFLFAGLHIFEYYDPPFTISDSVFGSFLFFKKGLYIFTSFFTLVASSISTNFFQITISFLGSAQRVPVDISTAKFVGSRFCAKNQCTAEFYDEMVCIACITLTDINEPLPEDCLNYCLTRVPETYQYLQSEGLMSPDLLKKISVLTSEKGSEHRKYDALCELVCDNLNLGESLPEGCGSWAIRVCKILRRLESSSKDVSADVYQNIVNVDLTHISEPPHEEIMRLAKWVVTPEMYQRLKTAKDIVNLERLEEITRVASVRVPEVYERLKSKGLMSRELLLDISPSEESSSSNRACSLICDIILPGKPMPEVCGPWAVRIYEKLYYMDRTKPTFKVDLQAFPEFFITGESLALSEYVTVFVYLLTAIFLSFFILSFSFALVVQKPETEKTSGYECGFESYDDARQKFNVRFYILAILFILFDIEAMFLIPWCVALSLINYIGYIIMMEFVLELFLGFLYVWYIGALDWE